MSSSVPLCSTQFLIWARDPGTHLLDNQNEQQTEVELPIWTQAARGKMVVLAQDVGLVGVLTSKGSIPEPPLHVVSTMCP